MARLTNASELAAVEAVLVPGTTYYLALYTADPGTSGTTGEVTGGSYARQAIVFAATGGNEVWNNAAINFTGMPAEGSGTPYFGVWTTLTAGTYVCGGSTNLSSAISAGATVAIASNALTAQVS